VAEQTSPAPEDVRVSVSHVVTDPVWSLRCWSVEVQIGALRGVIPAQCAADWLAVLMADPLDLFDVIPGLCGEDLEHELSLGLLSGTYELKQVRRAALDTISAVTGRPWWFAMRLIKTAIASWEVVGGEVAMRGVDATKMSVSAWLDAVYYICLRGLESSKAQMFMSQLEVPPPEEMPEDPVETMEVSADEFFRLAAS
jgi:hypothetical protein